jgi:OmpA-OmpF porin, OOP family
MKRTAQFVTCIFFSFLFVISGSAQQKDDAACKDHPLFSRMPGFWIHHCSQNQFDAFTFTVGLGKTTSVEGKLWRVSYYPQATMTSKPSVLQIMRNFENAAKSLGGAVVYIGNGKETLKLTKDGKEIWVEVTAEFTGKHGLTIVEKEAMNQDILANADFFSNNLKTTGHVAVEGIYFDTGKSELKPESEKAIAEIAKLLKSDAALKVYVVGHTDNVGGLENNLRLSQDRAQAVVQALVRNQGIEATRLKSFGNGPYAPVASNDGEEGRAKNRRVELVKQ